MPSPWSQTRPVELQERINACDRAFTQAELAEIKALESIADHCAIAFDIVDQLEAKIRGAIK